MSEPPPATPRGTTPLDRVLDALAGTPGDLTPPTPPARPAPVGPAAAELMVGEADIVVAGGTENMSAQPFMDFGARSGVTLGNRTIVDGTNSMITDPFSGEPMGITAENVAERFDVSREAQDAFALESQRSAQEALASGAVASEITPVVIATRRASTTARRCWCWRGRRWRRSAG